MSEELVGVSQIERYVRQEVVSAIARHGITSDINPVMRAIDLSPLRVGNEDGRLSINKSSLEKIADRYALQCDRDFTPENGFSLNAQAILLQGILSYADQDSISPKELGVINGQVARHLNNEGRNFGMLTITEVKGFYPVTRYLGELAHRSNTVKGLDDISGFLDKVWPGSVPAGVRLKPLVTGTNTDHEIAISRNMLEQIASFSSGLRNGDTGRYNDFSPNADALLLHGIKEYAAPSANQKQGDVIHKQIAYHLFEESKHYAKRIIASPPWTELSRRDVAQWTWNR